MAEKIIGREEDCKNLLQLYNSKSPEFVAICGRRRVGKTFLIRQIFDNKITFDFAGLANANTNEQLINFNLSINRCFNQHLKYAKNWLEAFEQLISQLQNSNKKRKVIFIDEISWLDTVRSNFVTALEHFWNGWASGRNDIMLIVCGSATSWITNKIINNHGGLHNRLTNIMYLEPFSLQETELFLKSRKIKFGRQEIVEMYMIFGGIPYYMSLLDNTLSLSQNVDNLCFKKNAKLKNEFSNLYASLFKNSDDYIDVVKALSKKKKGLTRTEIIKNSGLKSSKELTAILRNLESCGFIRTYNALHKKTRDKLYQLMDFYTLFYFNFLENFTYNNDNFWSNNLNSPKHNNWAGYAFETIVLQHINEVKKALGISGIQSGVASWKSEESDFDSEFPHKGCQIDLLIDRVDGVINICEMKFADKPFIISKDYEDNLRNKMSIFDYVSKTRKALHLTFITTFGILPNKHSGIVQKEISMTDLFS